MNLQLVKELQQQNPWLSNPEIPILSLPSFHRRNQVETLLKKDWDGLWLLLIGPRRAGKTTLGKYISQELIRQNRFKQLLYLNCDLQSIREWLVSPLFLSEALAYFHLESPIIFIDEVQRLKDPGLLLKTLADLSLPVKLIASGSSQLEIKSKVQEHLTGRNFTSLVLPLSFNEWHARDSLENLLLFGSYPQVVDATHKELLLGQIYQDYINKDIIEFLKISMPDTYQKMIGLIAHSSGQLVNYNQLACDCQINNTNVRHYISILEQTYVLAHLSPFVGNKRTELTSNPIFYFIDNGFRNFALRNFNVLTSRTDAGLLVESLVFQELYKYLTQNFLSYALHYWRTKAGAEVDFVIYKNDKKLLPIEVKYQTMQTATITRGYRSFLQAYMPTHGIIITKDFIDTVTFEKTTVHFIPLYYFNHVYQLIDKLS